MSLRILIVDDDESVREALSEALADEGFRIETATDGTQGLGRVLASDDAPDVILSDVRMPGMDGLSLLRRVRAEAPGVDVVLMTAFDDMPTVATAMREGAQDFLIKPLDLHELRRVLGRVLADRRLRAAADSSIPAPFGMPRLVGRDPAMIELYKRIGQIAGTRANVLVRGESGTGKEMVARAIHEQSADRAEPMVAVNCSAIPATLLESELFGHTRGAFTGATASRRGRFAVAGRGTIFLDEIGDTSADFQTKLLRVLQEREYFPVGADRAERTEARVIAATHRDLEQLTVDGRFREDLYYRLRVVDIRVPALRERPADIPLLVAHFVVRASANLGRRTPVVSDEALAELRRYTWPGNVRELENCVHRAVVMATGDVIRPEHLGHRGSAAAPPATLMSLAEIECDHVARVMAATGGHKARAARILGVSRPRLNRMLQQYGLE